MTIRCLAIDDEPLALNVIKKYVSRTSNLILIEACKDPIDALAFIKGNQVDLIFLDINMPKLSGISLIKSIKNPPLFIFTTAYPDYAVEGFELDAIDYLLKPFSYDRFCMAIKKANEQLFLIQLNESETKNHLMIKSDRKLYRVAFDDIIHLEAYGDYVKIFMSDKMILTKQKLSQMLVELPSTQFLQTHRSHIVSIKHIEFLESNQVHIAGKSLPISNGFREQVMQLLNKE